jgi:hypothetical protein
LLPSIATCRLLLPVVSTPMGKLGTILTFLFLGFVMLVFYTNNEQAERDKVIATTTDVRELVNAIMHDEHTPATLSRIGDTLTVTYDIGDGKNSTLVTLYEIYVKKIGENIFARFPGINTLRVVGMTRLVDLRGNETNSVVLQTTFSRANASTIQWHNVPYSNIPRLADQYYIHPVMLKDE